MNDSESKSITVATDAISRAIDKRVKEEFEANIALHSNFSEQPEFLNAVNSIEDPQLKTEMLSSYLKVIEESQKAKNEALLKLVESEVRRKEEKSTLENEIKRKAVAAETEQNNLKAKIFSDKSVVLFLMCAPIVVAVGLVSFMDSYVFAFLIILVWYGVSLALYFSQDSKLNNFLDEVREERVEK